MFRVCAYLCLIFSSVLCFGYNIVSIYSKNCTWSPNESDISTIFAMSEICARFDKSDFQEYNPAVVVSRGNFSSRASLKSIWCTNRKYSEVWTVAGYRYKTYNRRIIPLSLLGGLRFAVQHWHEDGMNTNAAFTIYCDLDRGVFGETLSPICSPDLFYLDINNRNSKVEILSNAFVFSSCNEDRIPIKTTKITNKSDSTIEIKDIISTSRWIECDVDSKTILPGESIKLICKINPIVFDGYFDDMVYINTDLVGEESIAVSVTGRILPSWSVSPSRVCKLKNGDKNCIFHIKPIDYIGGISNTIIKGPEGSNFLLSPGVDDFIVATFTPPSNLPPGYHSWVIEIYTEDLESRPLRLYVEMDAGEEVKAVPDNVTMTPVKDNVVVDFTLSPGINKDFDSDIDLNSIKIEPSFSGIDIFSCKKISPSEIKVSIKIAKEQMSLYSKPKTLHITVPNYGTAVVELSKQQEIESAEKILWSIEEIISTNKNHRTISDVDTLEGLLF